MDGGGSGTGGAEALRDIVRLLTRGLKSACDTEVQQRLTNFVEAAGTPFSEYRVELRRMVSNLQHRGIGLMSEDGVELKTKALLSDQYLATNTLLSVFMDRVHLFRLFVYVADFVAHASSCFGQAKASGIIRRGSNPGRSRYDGGVMEVARAGTDLEEENHEMRQVFAG